MSDFDAVRRYKKGTPKSARRPTEHLFVIRLLIECDDLDNPFVVE